MKLMIALFVILSFALPAAAQTAAGKIPDTVFGEEEKRIITDYMKNKMGLPETAKKPTSQKDDDEDEAKAKGKNKDKKNKGKDKAKNKDKKNKGKDKAKAKGKDKKKQMPPGLARRSELPPGLARHDTLPPGLQGRELPADLASQLPEPEKGQQRIIVDDSVVLIEKASGRILDIILGGKP